MKTFRFIYTVVLLLNLLGFIITFQWINVVAVIFMLSMGILTELYTMYKEFRFFGHTYYIQIGREVGSHWCAYLISWGQLWFNENGTCEYASLHGIFSSLK